jgi:hypothetical protein
VQKEEKLKTIKIIADSLNKNTNQLIGKAVKNLLLSTKHSDTDIRKRVKL